MSLVRASVPATFAFPDPPGSASANFTVPLPASGPYASGFWTITYKSNGGGRRAKYSVQVGSDTLTNGVVTLGTNGTNTEVINLDATQLAAANSVLTGGGGNLAATLLFGDLTNITDAYTGDTVSSLTLTLTGCLYALWPTSASFGIAGGLGTATVTAGIDCSWTATTAQTWLHVDTPSGTGSGPLSYHVDANGGPARTGTITVTGGLTFTVYQDADCAQSIAPTSAHYGVGGGSGTFAVTDNGACGWVATPQVSWLHVTAGGSGSGGGTVSYSVDAQAPGGSAQRVGTINCAGQVFTVTQDGLYTVALAYHETPRRDGIWSRYASVTFPYGYAPGTSVWTAIGAPAWEWFASVKPRGWLLGELDAGVLVLRDPATGLELAAGVSVAGADIFLLDEQTH